MLLRKLVSIYIPPVTVLEDTQTMNQLLELHYQQKLLFNDLIKGGVDHDEVLEALEAYIGIKNLDNYCARVDKKLDIFEANVLQQFTA